MLTDGEILDHVQHMGVEEMDVELIESDDDDVDIKSSDLATAKFIAQLLVLRTQILHVQRLAYKILAMRATCGMNCKQEGIKRFLPIVDI